jgi:hypothetical protein
MSDHIVPENLGGHFFEIFSKRADAQSVARKKIQLEVD